MNYLFSVFSAKSKYSSIESINNQFGLNIIGDEKSVLQIFNGEFVINKEVIEKLDNIELLLVIAQYNLYVLQSNSITSLIQKRVIELDCYDLLIGYAQILLKHDNITDSVFIYIIQLYTLAITNCNNNIVEYHVKNGNLAINYFLKINNFEENDEEERFNKLVCFSQKYLEEHNNLLQTYLLLQNKHNMANFYLAKFYSDCSIGSNGYTDLSNNIMVGLVKINYLPAIIFMGNNCLKTCDKITMFRYYARALYFLNDEGKFNMVMDELKKHFTIKTLLILFKEVELSDRMKEEIKKLDL